MRPQDWTDEQIVLALGAARAVAGADGVFEEHERSLLEAAARVLECKVAIDALPAVSPADLKKAGFDEKARLRVIQALLLVALMDGDVAPSELKTIRGYAEALGVDEPRLKNMKQLADGQARLVKLDLWRRSEMLQGATRKAWETKGVKGLWQFFAGIKGLSTDASLAWRYKELGLLPEGTFGRTYWAHMTQRKFSFPGEVAGFPEELAKHDLCHVIGDYDTDPYGECEVIGFISGFMKSDPFGYLFQIFIHMQLGVEIFDGTPVEHLLVPPERILAALERGSRVTRDLYDPSWDYWADFPRPLDEVRAEYGVAPRA